MKNKRQYSDQELIAAIRSGGSACEMAMEYMYKKHIDRIVGFIVQRNGSREEAKDIFQDAVVNLLVSIRSGKFEGKSTLGTYLYAISKNLWYRRFNRSLRSDEIKAAQAPDETDSDTPEILLMNNDQEVLLSRLMDQLKDKCKGVLSMWAQKYSMKEIAEALGYGNEQVVRNKKNLCLKELKELVRKHPEVRNLVKELVS